MDQIIKYYQDMFDIWVNYWVSPELRYEIVRSGDEYSSIVPLDKIKSR